MSAAGQRRRQSVSRTQTVAAPIGGLNAIDALASMPETDAIVMDNFVPQPSYVALRNGYSKWATGFPGWVESIFCYSNGSGDKLFGVSGTAVYDATTSGAIGAAVVTGLTNARWEYVNVATAGGQFLYAANATDSPLLYDGTTWTKITGVSTPAITGVTTTLLRNPAVWKNRVWFIENGTLHAWYLPTASIGGAASMFDFGPLFRLGGQLQTILTVSLTDGSTFQNYIGFLSSQGELLLYNGTDPAFAGSFNLVGIYNVGKPVGRRCWFTYGDDAIVITSNGFVSLKQMISIGKLSQVQSISAKILNLVNNDVQSYSSHFGWQGVTHALGNKVIINVPQTENSRQYQYVMNTITNSWCSFGKVSSPWNAATFEVQGNNLYFGGNTFVALADTGQADDSGAITGLLKTAFNYLGSDRQKMMTMIRPLFQTTGNLAIGTVVNMDFSDMPPMNTQVSIPAGGSPWDTSSWNTSSWSAGSFIQTQWQTIVGVGFACAAYIEISTASIQANLQAIDFLFQDGGVL